MAEHANQEITRNDRSERFELVEDPAAAYLEFRRAGDHITLMRTEVDDELEGEGVGSALVREALQHAQESNLTVVPECSFVAGWLDRHPERAAELEIAAP